MMSIRWVDNNLQTCIRSVREGLDLDKNGNNKDAYEKYLQSINFISHTLLKDAASCDFHVCAQTRKLVSLMAQCTDRVQTLLGSLPVNPPITNNPPKINVADLPSVPTSPPISPPSARSSSSTPSSTSSSSSISPFSIKSEPTPFPQKRYSSRSDDRLSGPMAQAMRQNQQLMAAYKARMAQCSHTQRHKATDMSLTLQRKMAENVALAKAREKALEKKLKERRLRLEAEAARRFSSSLGMSKDEQERRRLYSQVLEYEADSDVLRSFREKLKADPSNTELIEELINFILSISTHPLSQYLQKCQYAAYSKINPLLQKCAKYYPNFDALIDSSKTPVEAATDNTPSQEDDSSPSDYNISSFDDLFEDLDSSHDQSHDPSNDQQQSTSIEEMEKQALTRHFQNVARDVHDYLEKIQVMFTVAYEEMDNPTARDVCYACIEKPFFQPIWPYLLALSRLANKSKEESLAKVMQQKLSDSQQDLKVGNKFCLEEEIAYEPVIEELRTLLTLVAPLAKLECIVRISRQICLCVERYYSERSEEVPAIGADDLLPILAYVVIKSCLPQLVSECYTLEEFVHEGYLMGEEGYCLTSLQTAISYAISLSD